MKARVIQAAVCLYCVLQLATANTYYGIKVNPKLSKPKEPEALSPVTDGTLFIYWGAVKGATGYSVRAYNERLDLLEKHRPFLTNTFLNLTKLEKHDGYRVTVSAIYDTEDGDMEESEQSVPLYVNADEICKGGQQLKGCLAHCVSTCRKPDPVCDRRCVGGCQCPKGAPFWDGKKCQPSYNCPIVSGKVKRPQNLQVFSDDTTNDVVLTWDRVEGVDEFLVQVMTNRKDMVMQMPVTSNMALLQGLVRGTRYIFRVSTVNKFQREYKDPMMARSLSPPGKVFAAAIHKTGFQAYWTADPNAIRYKVRLLGGDKKTVLFAHDNLATPSVYFKDLTPGTQYYFQVASAEIHESFGPYSALVSALTPGSGDVNAADSAADLTSSINLDFQEPITTPKPTTTTKPTTTPKPTTPKPTTTTTEEPTTTIATTTTQVETTTATPLCKQKYNEAVMEAAMAAPADRSKIVFPKCQANGLFTTSKCSGTQCHCIDAYTGLAIEKSEFVYDNLFPINCNEFGESETSIKWLKAFMKKETQVSLSWEGEGAVAAYIVKAFDPNDKLTSVDTVKNNNRATVRGLSAGTQYLIDVKPVNFLGRVGSGKTITIETKKAPELKDLIVNEERFGNWRVTLRWSGSSSSYTVTTEDADGNELEEDRITREEAIVDNLSPLMKYKLTVKDSNRPQLPALTTNLDRLCHVHPIDLIIAIDSSRNGHQGRFFQSKRVLKDLVNSIANDDTRVAALKYSRNVDTEFHFNRYSKPKDMGYGLGNITYNGILTSNTAMALDFMRIMFFSDSTKYAGYVPRPNAIKVVVLFEGGRQMGNIVSKSQQLKQAGVVMMVVGPKKNQNNNSKVASDSQLSFGADSKAELAEASAKIAKLLCFTK